MRAFVTVILLAAPALAAAGCTSSSTGPIDLPVGAGTVELDASSASQFVYFNLGTGKVVSVASPAGSSDWDLAFRGAEVRLNGGVVGPKGVSGFNLANNAGATPQQILEFTPENQQAAFEAVGPVQVAAAGEFITEALTPSPRAWLASGAAGPVANPAASWKLQRTGAQSFALFRVTGTTSVVGADGLPRLATVTVEYRFQDRDGFLSPPRTATLDRVANTPALDLFSGAAVDPTGCNWDFIVNGDFSLLVNTACGVGTAPLDPSENFSAVSRADNAVSYGGFLAGFAGAVPFSSALNDPRGPFLANLAANDRIAPTFNIYLVRVGSAVFKVQVVGFYSAEGVAGHPTVRYARVE